MQAAQEAKKQILVVEDEGLIADDIQRRLERLGYAVPAIASSGEEALRFARSIAFDLVLMDIRLHGEMDGIATAQALKDELETPVVYLTAHADPDMVSRAKITEPLGYILKPISDVNLRTTVQIAIHKHEMERRVRASEAWLSTTLASVGEGIVATNRAGDIVFLNRVAERLTGWTGAAALGRPLTDVLRLLEESTGREAGNPVSNLFASQRRDLLRNQGCAYLLVSKSGASTPVEVGCFENRSEEELLGSILVVRDIRARRDMEARLIQSQRMEAIANLAGGLAHDFNNLLMVILGYADELERELKNDLDRRHATEIKQAATMAGSISKQLLTLSRREVVNADVLDVDGVIGEIQTLIARSLGSGCKLALELGSPAGFVRGDRNRLKQVFLNLALNARDAMPQGGEMRIASSLIEIGEESPQWRECRPGRYVRIQVTDSGQGMDAATLARIFEPFFTTKRSGTGTGLGLAMVHAIIVQSEGYVSASSEIGRGTSFEILLPRAGKPQKVGETREETAVNEAATTVLLVDDEDSVRRLMHACLKREGYQLLQARDAEEAERLAEACAGPIHVLVTDVAMPGMSGLQLAARLKPQRPEMKTLFVSGYAHDELGRSGLAPAEVLSKPFRAPELAQRVRALLQQAPALIQ
jgi:two-component system, cell cycle sensor histidine kinase and response regulator CckA